MKKRRKLYGRILKITAIVLTALIILPVITVFAGRGINAVRFNIRDENGIWERSYVSLGGIEQVIHIRGRNVDNPIIIWLHGGPGWSNAYELVPWEHMIKHYYTLVHWDQRGSGRTYLRNPDAPLSFDILLGDLDELVDYVTGRFNQPVYIVGTSWGSVLGIEYASRHPERIEGFVGVAQNINFGEGMRVALEAGYRLAMAAGDVATATEIRELYDRLNAINFAISGNDLHFEKILLAQSLPFAHLPVPRGEGQAFATVFSPWFGMTEARQVFNVMFVDNRLFFERNRPLFDTLGTFTPPETLEIPVAFIMGSIDYITPTSLVVEYYERVEAPSKQLFIIEGSGHAPFRSQPELFVEMLKEALQSFQRT